MSGTAHIHLGAHKTGTTFSQFAIRRNAANLKSNGIAVLWGRDRIMGTGTRAKYVATPAFQRRLGVLLDKRIQEQGCSSILYTFEGSLSTLYSGDGPGPYPHFKECLQSLHEVFAERYDRVKVYYSIRNPGEFLTSFYIQKVKEGHANPFPEYIARLREKDQRWAHLVGTLVTLFGAENVEITDYSTARQLPSFGGLLDWSLVTPDHAEKNQSYDARMLKVALAALPHLETREERAGLRDFIQTCMVRDPNDRPALLSFDDTAMFDAIYRSDLEEIAAMGVTLRG